MLASESMNEASRGCMRMRMRILACIRMTARHDIYMHSRTPWHGADEGGGAGEGLSHLHWKLRSMRACESHTKTFGEEILLPETSHGGMP